MLSTLTIKFIFIMAGSRLLNCVQYATWYKRIAFKIRMKIVAHMLYWPHNQLYHQPHEVILKSTIFSFLIYILKIVYITSKAYCRGEIKR